MGVQMNNEVTINHLAECLEYSRGYFSALKMIRMHLENVDECELPGLVRTMQTLEDEWDKNVKSLMKVLKVDQ